MFKITLFVFILFGYCIGQVEKPKAAILDFEVKVGLEKDEARQVTLQFQSAISSYDYFSLLSRMDVEKLRIDEEMFSKSADTLGILAKNLKVKYLIIGSIGKLGDLYIATAKVVDDESKIVVSKTENYSGRKEGLAELMEDLAKSVIGEFVPDRTWLYVSGGLVSVAVAAYYVFWQPPLPDKNLPEPPKP